MPSMDGNAAVEASLTLAKVRSEIERLPEEQREIVFLVCIEDLSYREAAAILGVPAGTVMSRLSRARLHLRQAAGIESDTERSMSDKG